MDLQREAKKEGDKIKKKKKKQTKLRKNAIFGELIENSMKKCGYIDRPFLKKNQCNGAIAFGKNNVEQISINQFILEEAYQT